MDLCSLIFECCESFPFSEFAFADFELSFESIVFALYCDRALPLNNNKLHWVHFNSNDGFEWSAGLK